MIVGQNHQIRINGNFACLLNNGHVGWTLEQLCSVGPEVKGQRAAQNRQEV